MSKIQTDRRVIWWLNLLIAMCFLQVMIGGITRITGSGLSITKWELVTGAIPPLSQQAWQAAFELYKQTPQYALINTHFTLSDFKFIYFWEWLHRLWGRILGLALFMPLLFFLWKRKLSRKLFVHICIAVVWIGVVGAYGWLMVTTGFKNKPWVSPFYLATHLALASVLFAWLVWIRLSYVKGNERYVVMSAGLKRGFILFFVLLCIQLFFGGMMSGMKAGLVCNTWPLMQGSFFPQALSDSKLWTIHHFLHYSESAFAPLAVQFMHRCTAYLLIMAVVLFFVLMYNKIADKTFKRNSLLLPFIVVIQASLGVITVINCTSKIPLLWGVLHQCGALITLGICVYVLYHLVKTKN